MNAILSFISDSGVVGWIIIATGIGSICLVIERTNTLYFKYALNAEEFTAKIFKL